MSKEGDKYISSLYDKSSTKPNYKKIPKVLERTRGVPIIGITLGKFFKNKKGGKF
tara:strand:- start:155 stop:319 length:165 start_codon:yes stop_codon:yes gene_type:complete